MMSNEPMTLQQCWLIINDNWQAKVQPLHFPSSPFHLFQSYHLPHSFFLMFTCLGKPECSCFPVPPVSAGLGWTAPLCSEQIDSVRIIQSDIISYVNTFCDYMLQHTNLSPWLQIAICHNKVSYLKSNSEKSVFHIYIELNMSKLTKFYVSC